ncbi:MAG: anti-sigma factor [Myxococcales bacterium]|nr:anti-sigma factor [Myxococcales bacterium]
MKNTHRVPTFVLGALLLTAACKQSQPMTASPTVPASQGTVTVSATDEGNTKVAVKVKHLAQPSKVEPDAAIYVVWIRPPSGELQSLGALKLDGDLDGTLEAVTPHRRFQLTVTPEPNQQVVGPSHPPVFTAEVDRLD